MMLSDLIALIDSYAAASPVVRLVVPNDIFRLNTLPDAEYPCLGWTQNQHRVDIDNGLVYISLAIFYVDRLADDKSNETGIQSAGISILTDLLNYMQSSGAYTFGDITMTTFNQRFTDECAGVYTNVTFQVPGETLCYEN